MVNRPFLLQAIFRLVPLNPGRKNITRLFYSSKSTDHSIRQSTAVGKDDKHSAARLFLVGFTLPVPVLSSDKP